MSEKCQICGDRIFDESGQSWGNHYQDYGWVCDNPECEDIYDMRKKANSLRVRLCEILKLDYTQVTDEEVIEVVKNLMDSHGE